MIKRRMTTGRRLAVEVDVLSAQNFNCLAKKSQVIKDFFLSASHISKLLYLTIFNCYIFHVLEYKMAFFCFDQRE